MPPANHPSTTDLNQIGTLKLVGRISLWFGCVALTALGALLLLPSTPIHGYGDALKSLAITQDNLLWVMMVAGLLLILGTGITTWLITLYSSFRVAGPLYRFARNLEVGAEQGEVPRIRLRRNDQLQAECVLLEQTLSRLYDYYWELDQQLVQLLVALESPDSGPADLEAALQALRQLEARVQTDAQH